MNKLIAIWLLAYIGLSFVIAAIYVRQAPRNRASKFLRKHFYLFPLVPLTLPALTIFSMIGGGFRFVFRALRNSFEKMSGKKTYRRKSNYHRY